MLMAAAAGREGTRHCFAVSALTFGLPSAMLYIRDKNGPDYTVFENELNVPG